LCLSCKACSSDCPAVVDIARWKSEVLHRKYKGKVRPIDHYVLGWLPRWAKFVGRFGPLVPVINAVLSFPPITKLFLKVGGLAPERQLMDFARTPFRVWWRKYGAAAHPIDPAIFPSVEPVETTPSVGANETTGVTGTTAPNPSVEEARQGRPETTGNHATSTKSRPGRGNIHGGPPVVLWTDSFSDTIAPNVPIAAVKVLDAAGYQIIVPEKQACCGLTWISTGQLDGARRRLENLMSVLGPYAVNGIPIVGLEPSCTAVLRSDLVDLFPNDPRARAIAAATHTVAELLTDPDTAPQDWRLPDLSDLKAVVQPHCHHHSVMGYGADEALLKQAGAQIEVLAGCCGLAGNFGMQKGHYDVSVAVAENALLPALRQADNKTEFLADGFSCRTQALQLAGKPGKALIEVIAERI